MTGQPADRPPPDVADFDASTSDHQIHDESMTENTDDASAAELRERVAELEAQLEQQQQTIQQMLPSRRSLLKAGGAGAAALLAASATSGSASAATGTIGGPNNTFNWYAEDIRDKNDNTPITLPGDGSVDIDSAVINSNEVYIQGSEPSSPSAGDVWIDNDG